MSVKEITANELRRMNQTDGLILQGCSGNFDKWVDRINELLSENGILQDGSQFRDCYTFNHDGVTCLFFPFEDDVTVDIGKLAM